MVEISRSLVGRTVIEMLMSLQEMLPAAEEEGADLSSLLLVLLHLKHFSTDWSKAKQTGQTAVFIATQPQFRRTAVIRPLPQRFTSLNSSDHSGSVLFFPPTSSCHQSDVWVPPLTAAKLSVRWLILFLCFQANRCLCYSDIPISLTMQRCWKLP